MTQQPDPFSELRGLMAEATPGPWKLGGSLHYIYGNDDRPVMRVKDIGLPRSDERISDDAALIVAAVNALPALLDERDRLHEGLRKRGMRIFDIDPVTDALDALTEWKGYSDKFEARALSAEGEVEKLRSALTNLLAHPDCVERLKDLDRGIGTKTREAVFLTARQALSQEIG